MNQPKYKFGEEVCVRDGSVKAHVLTGPGKIIGIRIDSEGSCAVQYQLHKDHRWHHETDIFPEADYWKQQRRRGLAEAAFAEKQLSRLGVSPKE